MNKMYPIFYLNITITLHVYVKEKDTKIISFIMLELRNNTTSIFRR